MKIFVDTAEIDEIKTAISWGIVDGVTTNPSLIKKAVDKRQGKITMVEYIGEIVKITPGPVSLEVLGGTANEMIKQGKLLYKKFRPYGNVAIKIPVNPSLQENDGLEFDGLKAIKHLSNEGIPINVTLIMTPEQALLAAKAGAAYASPFAGRIDDYIRTKMGLKLGTDFQKDSYFGLEFVRKVCDKKATEMGQDNGVWSGVDLVARILRIYQNYGFKTEVIAASIRNPRQAREVAELGVHIATLPFEVIQGMVTHVKTAEGMRSFTADIVPSYQDLFSRE
jgi:transaldolase